MGLFLRKACCGLGGAEEKDSEPYLLGSEKLLSLSACLSMGRSSPQRDQPQGTCNPIIRGTFEETKEEKTVLNHPGDCPVDEGLEVCLQDRIKTSE